MVAQNGMASELMTGHNTADVIGGVCMCVCVCGGGGWTLH